MNFTIRMNKIQSTSKIEGSWTNQDYVNLLDLLDYPDAQSIPEAELFDMLSMAISDFDPDEAAKVALKYKLAEKLTDGQIDNISHEMLENKISEEYPDISLHYDLFKVNQLLHDAYNGKFPRIQASIINFDLSFKNKVKVTKEIILRTISDLLTDKSLLKRLYNEQLDSSQELKDAEHIIWELKPVEENNYQLITSDYWINRDDFAMDEFSGVLRDEEVNHPDDDEK